MKYQVSINHAALNGVAYIFQTGGVVGLDKSVITKKYPHFRSEWTGVITFFNDDKGFKVIDGFEPFKIIESSPLRYEPIYIEVNGECLNFKGIGRNLKYKKCQCSIEIVPNDSYQCVYDNWEKSINIEEIEKVSTSASPFDSIVETDVEIVSIDRSGLTRDEAREQIENLIPNRDYWCIKQRDFVGKGSVWELTVTWWREVSATYEAWKPLPDGRFWRCPVLIGGDLEIKTLTEGKDLSTALIHIVDKSLLGCGVSCIKSDFLGIGEKSGLAPDNTIYEWGFENMQHLTIHQKSNVKRPLAPEKATGELWDITLKELFELFEKMQMTWRVIDGCLRIEHESYFASSDIHFLRGEYQDYSRNIDENLQRIVNYFWMDGGASFNAKVDYGVLFKGEESINSSPFSTDVSTIARHKLNDENVYDANSDISEEGFVIIMNELQGNGDYLISVKNEKVNGGLSWESIIKNMISGNNYKAIINDEDFEFKRILFNIKGSDIKIKGCCEEYKGSAHTKISEIPHISLGRIKETRLELGTQDLTISMQYAYQS